MTCSNLLILLFRQFSHFATDVRTFPILSGFSRSQKSRIIVKQRVHSSTAQSSTVQSTTTTTTTTTAKAVVRHQNYEEGRIDRAQYAEPR